MLRELPADLLMLAHAAFSIFVVAGLILILSGHLLGWRWIHNRPFRVCHLCAILFIVARVWLNLPCPFSAAEDSLRPIKAQPCILGNSTHTLLHRLAFRGNDPGRFSRSATLLGTLTLAAFLANTRTNRQKPILRFPQVPKGRQRIAQRFIAGFAAILPSQVPEGRQKTHVSVRAAQRSPSPPSCRS